MNATDALPIFLVFAVFTIIIGYLGIEYYLNNFLRSKR